MQQQTLLIAILAVVAIGMCAQAVTLVVAIRVLRFTGCSKYVYNRPTC